MKIYDVFISYRRTKNENNNLKAGFGGSEVAEALYRFLTAKGLRVFWDKVEMPDGHYFWDSIEAAIKTAPHYILVGSTDAFIYRDVDEENDERDFVKEEIALAIAEYEKNKSERTITVIQTAGAVIPEINVLPKEIRNITKAQRKFLEYGSNNFQVFNEVFDSVTNVNRRNLWFAAHRWLENSKQPGGRFASLNINESILPNASKNKKEQEAMPINVYSKENEGENRQSLLDAMGSNSNHLYLIGQGGIGKTTALMHIMNSAYVDKQYSENAQVPIFVELSFAPDTKIKDKNGNATVYADGKSSFIRRSVFKQLRTDRTLKQISEEEAISVDDVFKLPKDSAVEPVEAVFMQKKPVPEYLLLLDGLNEVSTVIIEETGLSVVQMIMREIDMLIAECPNVRVVLTSRSDDAAIYNDSVSRLYLSGIDEKTIREYLENTGLSGEHIDKALADDNLREILNIPLFLTMYAALSECDEASAQGEILKLFFNDRRRNISVYTMQDRLSAVERNIEKSSSVQKNRIDADMQNFILDFILPEMAWNMERNNEFYLRIRDIRKIIEPILTDTDDLSVCGEFGREIFSKYRNGASAKMHTYKVAKKIFERLGDDITEVTENIINCCVFALGIMQESNSKYGFVHHHIRDYFAAVKNINTIRLSVYLYEEDEKELALECMNKTFKDEPVNYTVRRFMGEYLGEHRNRPYYANDKWNYGVPSEKCDRNLIKRALDIYRGYFDGECGYGIYSIITILIEVRKDLCGANLSYLDFYRISLNDVYCAYDNLCVNLTGSKIKGENIFLEEHFGQLRTLNISGDSKYFVTTSDDKRTKIWDVRTLRCVVSLYDEAGMFSAIYSLDNNTIVSASDDGFVKLWDAKEQCYKDSSKENIPWLNTVEYSPEGGYIIARPMFGGVHFFSAITLNEEFLGNDSCEYNQIVFSEKDKYIATVKNSDTLQIWDAKTLENISEHRDNGKFINKVCFSSNGETLILTYTDGTVSVFQTKNMELEFTLGRYDDWIRDVFWGLADEHIIIVSDDIRIWNVASHECEKIIEKQRNAILSHKGKYIITSDYTGIIKIWSAMDFTLIKTIKNNSLSCSDWLDLKCTPDGQVLIAYNNLSISLFNLNGFECLGNLAMHPKGVESICYSPDGEKIIMLSADKTLKIWDAKNYICKSIISNDTKDIYSLKTDYKNNKVIVKYNHGLVKVWCPKRKCVIDETVETYNSWALREYSSDKRHILVPSEDGITILNADTMTPIGNMAKDCNSSVDLIRYSPVGESIITVHCDGEAIKWDAKTLSKSMVINGHSNNVHTVHYSPDGSFFVTGSKDGTAKIWTNTDDKKIVCTLYDTFGLYVNGVDFSNLDSSSYFTDDEKIILKQYGAIID